MQTHPSTHHVAPFTHPKLQLLQKPLCSRYVIPHGIQTALQGLHLLEHSSSAVERLAWTMKSTPKLSRHLYLYPSDPRLEPISPSEPRSTRAPRSPPPQQLAPATQWPSARAPAPPAPALAAAPAARWWPADPIGSSPTAAAARVGPCAPRASWPGRCPSSAAP